MRQDVSVNELYPPVTSVVDELVIMLFGDITGADVNITSEYKMCF